MDVTLRSIKRKIAMHKRLTALLVSICFIAAPGFAAAEDVALDSSFGNEGVVTTKLGSSVDLATAIGVQDDGRIVVAGSSDNGLGSKMAVIRYLPDGTVDHEFSFSMGGSLGSVHADDAVHAIALEADGRILLGGTLTVDGVREAAVVSLLPQGQLDVNFGTNGISYIEAGAVDSEIRDLVIDEQNRIIVSGFVDDGTRERPLVARFNENGEPDLLFSETGVFVDDITEGRATGLAESADGSVIVGGYSVRDDGWKGLYLGRFLENGELDTQFGEDGRAVWFDDVEQILVHDIALSPDEKIILAGQVETADGQNRIMLARYEKSGEPDTGFGENGILVHDTGLDSGVQSLVVNPDTTIIAAGYQASSTGKDMVIIRYLPPVTEETITEALEQLTETSVSGDEPVETISISALSIVEGSMNIPVETPAAQNYEADLITTELAGSDEVSNAILMTEDGSIYTVGYSGDDENSSFIVARYSGLVGEGTPVDSGAAAVTEFYRIGTMPVTGVTRVGAMSGGNIVLKGAFDSTDCTEGCEESCQDAEDSASCISTCEESCQIPSVIGRGVVYSIEPNPDYEDGTASGTDDAAIDSDADAASLEDSNDSGGTDSTTTGTFFDFSDYFVKKGQTEDGSGVGTYTSEIEGINPQTVYYVRAYGLLSDGSIIYGNQYSFRTEDSCFIATAAFGSIDMFAVKALRDFRDHYLIPYEWGQYIVNTYYFISPTIAELVEQSFFLRLLIILLLTPAVAGAVFLLYTTVLMKCALIIAAPLAWCYIAFHKKEYGIVHA